MFFSLFLSFVPFSSSFFIYHNRREKEEFWLCIANRLESNNTYSLMYLHYLMNLFSLSLVFLFVCRGISKYLPWPFFSSPPSSYSVVYITLDKPPALPLKPQRRHSWEKECIDTEIFKMINNRVEGCFFNPLGDEQHAWAKRISDILFLIINLKIFFFPEIHKEIIQNTHTPYHLEL